MNKLMLTLLSVLLSITYSQAQLSKTIDVATPGSLETLVGGDKATVTDLTLTGTINDADFTTIKQMSALKVLDMLNVDIESGAIPAKAFENRAMDKISLPKSLKSVGAYAFDNVSLSSDLDLSNCLSQPIFSDWTFNRGRYHVILPPNLIHLSKGTFGGFKGSVDLPSTLEIIGETVFYQATLSKGLILPISLKEIGKGAFQYATIPSIDFPVSSKLEIIGETVFYQATLSKGLIIPIGIKEIGKGAFQHATIPSIDFPVNSKLVSVKDNAFDNVSLSSDLDLSNCLSQPVFSDWTFSRGRYHVILPPNLIHLSKGTFGGFKGSVDLPSTLEIIGETVFYKATLSKGLILPASLKEIGKGAFQHATISSIDFPVNSKLVSVKENAFDNVSLSSDLDLSNCLSQPIFSDWTFNKGRYHVILPPNLIHLSKGTFGGFKGSVDLPSTLEIIGETVFYQAALSKGLILPAILKEIGKRAFYYSSITNILLPASVATIQENAFIGCTQLEYIISLNPTPPALGAAVFDGVDKTTCKLYVPKESMELYAAADQWKDFLIYEYEVFLTDNLTFKKTTGEPLYQIKSGESFEVSVSAIIMNGVRLGVFNASNGTFIEDIVKSVSGNAYTCSISTDLVSGTYVIQPYVMEDGEMKIVSRQEGSHIIDRLLLSVKNNWNGMMLRSATTEVNNHLLLSTGQEDFNQVTSGKEFQVFVRHTNPSESIKVGLFNPSTGELVSKITKSVNGNIFTCVVPAEFADSTGILYTLMPYQEGTAKPVFVERLANQSYLADRLPLTVVTGEVEEPEPTVLGCVTISAKDSKSNASIFGGKYLVEGENFSQEYTLTSEGLTIDSLVLGTYTITEVSPAEGYNPASEKTQTVTIIDDNCLSVVFNNVVVEEPVITVPDRVKLQYTEDQGKTILKEYEGVRVGEYYWMNTPFVDNHIALTEPGLSAPYLGLREWRADYPSSMSVENVNLLHHRLLMFENAPYTSDQTSYFDQILTGASNQEKMASFEKYYGTYYTRAHIEWMNVARNYVTVLGEEGNFPAQTAWDLPQGTDIRQLLAMCGNGTTHEVRQYLSMGKEQSNVPDLVKVSGNLDWFDHNSRNIGAHSNGFDPSNTNKYGFSLFPSGSKFHNPDTYEPFANDETGKAIVDQFVEGRGDKYPYEAKRGDFIGLNQMFSLALHGLQAFMLHDYAEIRSLSTTPYHWTPIRWCRPLTDEELGYKLYINEPTFVDTRDALEKLKSRVDNGETISIKRVGLTEDAGEGFVELPRGYLRGFYVQYMLESNSGKTISDIVNIALQNPYVWGMNNAPDAAAPTTREAIMDEKEVSDLKIYPNPVTDILYLESGSEISQVQVYSTAGQMVLNKTNVGSSVDVSQLSAGTYILKLTIGTQTSTHKIIKK